MGGAIVQEMLFKASERVRSATLIMASSGDPGLPPPTPAALSALVKPRPSEREAFVAFYLDMWRVLWGGNFAFEEARMRAEASETFERSPKPPGVARQMLAIIASGNRKAALREVRLPVLVIHGTEDPLVPVAAGHDLVATIPGATLEIVEGMGHSLPRGAWDQMLGAIARYAPAERDLSPPNPARS